MTTVLLVRHATCDPVGKSLAGRRAGVSLNAEGRAQAERLARWLAPVPVAAVFTSPLERAHETAAYLAAARGVAVVPNEGLTELDFGEWTGRRLDALAGDPRWPPFNAFRSGTRPPGGEMMLEAQARAVAAVLAIAARYPDATVAVVSHADVIKSIVCHFAGIPLDHFLRLEIAPASVTALAVHEWGAQLLALNASAAPPG